MKVHLAQILKKKQLEHQYFCHEWPDEQLFSSLHRHTTLLMIFIGVKVSFSALIWAEIAYETQQAQYDD